MFLYVYIKLYLDVVRCIFIIWLSPIKTQKNNAAFSILETCVFDGKGAFGLWREEGKVS